MNTSIYEAFIDEMDKIGKFKPMGKTYPVSRFMTGRISGDFGQAEGARNIQARATRGRLKRGKGISKREAKRLAEAANISPKEMKQVMANIEAKTPKGADTELAARVMTSRWTGFPPGVGHLNRALRTRGLVGRKKMNKPLTVEEKKLFKMIEKNRPAGNRVKDMIKKITGV